MKKYLNDITFRDEFEASKNKDHLPEYVVEQVGNNYETSQQIEAISKEDIDHTIQILQDYIRSNKTSLNITTDERTGTILIRIICDKDGKIIREISKEEIIDHAVKMKRLERLLVENNF